MEGSSMHWLKQHVGELILGTGVVHIVYGVVTSRPLAAALWRDGVVNSVDENDHERFGWLWFTTAGFGLISSGLLARSHIRRTGTLPVSFGASLLGMSLFNIALEPETGTWVVAAEAIVALAVAADGVR